MVVGEHTLCVTTELPSGFSNLMINGDDHREEGVVPAKSRYRQVRLKFPITPLYVHFAKFGSWVGGIVSELATIQK